MKSLFKGQWLFIKALLNNPSSVGAAFPSSPSLAKKMIQQVPKETRGLVIELGAGTGAITKYLTKAVHNDQLIIIERSEQMVNFLKAKFPEALVLLGDAMDLPRLVEPYNKPVEAIISSLPFRSIPSHIAQKIQSAIVDSLVEKGLLIQFTYDPRENAKEMFPDLTFLYRKRVWFNLPPANVDVYQK